MLKNLKSIFSDKLWLGILLLVLSIWVFLPLVTFTPLPVQISAVVTALLVGAMGLMLTVMGLVERVD